MFANNIILLDLMVFIRTLMNNRNNNQKSITSSYLDSYNMPPLTRQVKSNCFICKLPIIGPQNFLTCLTCECLTHAICFDNKLSPEEFDLIVGKWKCKTCQSATKGPDTPIRPSKDAGKNLSGCSDKSESCEFTDNVYLPEILKNTAECIDMLKNLTLVVNDLTRTVKELSKENAVLKSFIHSNYISVSNGESQSYSNAVQNRVDTCPPHAGPASAVPMTQSSNPTGSGRHDSALPPSLGTRNPYINIHTRVASGYSDQRKLPTPASNSATNLGNTDSINNIDSYDNGINANMHISNGSDNGFILARGKRRRANNAVYGNKTGSSLLSAAPRKKSLFVSRLNVDTTKEELLSYLRDKNGLNIQSSDSISI